MANSMKVLYRGYGIEVQTAPAKAFALSGGGLRYRLSWTIFESDAAGQELASFNEAVVFLSREDAYRYGEKRAHAFIDGLVLEAR